MAAGVYDHPQGKQSSHYIHGHSNTRLYSIWSNMKNRCYNPNTKRLEWQHKNIAVCDEWRNNFEAFYNWAISHGYSDDLTLDRIDGNKNYCPENCRWTTMRVQNINKECVPEYEYDGIIFHQCEVFELFGIKRTTFIARLYKGWSVKEAIETPVGGDKHRS